MKTCTRCKEEKAEDEFSKLKRNSGSVDIYCKKCRREKNREWSANHRESELERYRLYRERNKEQIREKSRIRMQKRRQEKKEECLAYTREYRRLNKEKADAWDLKKRSKRRGAIEAETITRSQWSVIKDKYKNCCAYCLKKMKRLEMDHVIPLSKGGSHTVDNIVPACKSCNSSKNARDVYQWVSNKHGRLF